MINAGVKDRLDLIIKKLGVSGRTFEKECGLANGSYSSIGDRVGADKLNKILFRFPEISAEWLLVGRGEMMKAPEGAETKNEPSGERAEMKNLMNYMTGIISTQQKEISRLIAELELNGKRTDRMLNLLEREQSVGHREDFLNKITGTESPVRR